MPEILGVLEVPLGTSLSGPTRRLVHDLDEVARACNHARNRMVRAWMRWHEDNPGYVPQPRTDKKGAVKQTDKGAPVLESVGMPQHVEKLMYDAAIAAAPRIYAKILATCASRVRKALGNKLPPEERAPDRDLWFVWQAILADERSLPTHRSATIPVPCQDAALCYLGATSRKLPMGKRATLGPLLQACGDSAAVFYLPLFARGSGRDSGVVVRLETRQLPQGQRKLLQRIAAGAIKLRDSQLVKKRRSRSSQALKGKRRVKVTVPTTGPTRRQSGKQRYGQTRWVLQIAYEPPIRNLNLDKKRVATLWPQIKASDRPFCIEGPADARPWGIGRGRDLMRELARLRARQRSLQDRYKKGFGHGHGKKEFFAKFKPYARAGLEMQKRFTGELIEEIFRFLQRHDCGTLLYREPGLQARGLQTWFGQLVETEFGEIGMEFDWTKFLSRLTFKCQARGVVLKVERVAGKVLEEKFGKPKKEDNGKKPE